MSQPSFSAMYNFVRGRQLEGTFPGDRQTGIWPITQLRIGRGWGAIPEEAWKYDSSVWPPKEPPGLDAIAKLNRDFRYQRVRSLAEIKLVLGALKLAVTASLEISDAWYSAKDGKIPLSTPSKSLGNHSVLLVGYDDTAGHFKFRNSWGTNWGENGNGYIPYQLFQTTWIEGWMDDISQSAKRRSVVSLSSWAIREQGGGTFHCREFAGPEADRIGWAFAVERSDNLAAC